ncbi:hypothetical protein [Winogradskyella bathintestinalis]|uniref:hypothetical protein n=1 Tax=Winogradskyella bathintestinalis TaxID=3035208 RepID=UPI0025B32BC2|nr:hypothetical protein [Winogradskyella bathintestinalis]
MVSSYKHKTKENFNKLAKVNFNEKEVTLFFKKNNWPEIEAIKFYIFIKSKKWKTDKWKIIAKIFVKKNYKLEEPKPTSPISGYLDRIEKLKKNNQL